MMTASEYISQVLGARSKNEVKNHLPELKPYWLDTLYLANIHIQGIKPRYRNLRLYSDVSTYDTFNKSRFGNVWITPTGWQAKYQPYFEQLILNRYPTVREERFNWQCSIYPNFAQSLFLQAIDEIRGAIFQDSNYEYDFANENTAAYIYEKRFSGLDFFDWTTNVLITNIITDPNGYTVTMPAFWDDETEIVGQPTCISVSSETVLFADKNLLIWQEKNDVFVVDSEAFYRIPYDRKTKEYRINDVSILPHTLEKAPFTINGGYAMNTEFGMYYISFFNGAFDWANIAIRQFIDTEALNKDIIPITQMVQIECATCHGTGSVPTPCPDESSDMGCQSDCNKCSGKGHISRNMGDVISIQPEQVIDGKLPPYLQYISGDVANLEYSDKRFNQMYENFEKALYLKFIQEAQSGTAKALDRDKMYKFIAAFSDNIFDIITDCLVRIDGLLNNTKANIEAVAVRRPSQFILKSEADLRDELKALVTANAPGAAIKNVSDTLARLAAPGAATDKIIDVLSLYDPLRYKNDNQKTVLTNVAGAFTKSDLIRSVRCENELNRIIERKSLAWFLNASYEQVVTELDNSIQPYIDELPQMPVLMP